MPYKRKTRKYKKRRRRRRVPVSLSGHPFGMTRKVKHKYVDTLITVDPGIATSAHHYFSCNGMYDPDITGTGHQPMFFDCMGVLFDHYVVIGAKITVKFISIDDTYSQIVTLSVDDNTTSLANLGTRIENGSTKYKLLAPVSASAGNSVHTLSLAVNPNKFLGIPSPMSNSELKGSYNANPTEQCYFHIGCVAQDPAANPTGVKAMVSIEYTAIWREPKESGAN